LEVLYSLRQVNAALALAFIIMAPSRETLVGSYSTENLQRTISDISLEPSKEASGHEKLFIIIINKCVVFLIT
jgi:hypothetical protein